MISLDAITVPMRFIDGKWSERADFYAEIKIYGDFLAKNP
jgi:hypothetical protein